MMDLWLQYEDEDHDKVVLASDSDLVAAVEHARSAGWKVRALLTFLLLFLFFIFLCIEPKFKETTAFSVVLVCPT